MIKIDKGNVELEGDLLVLIGELTMAITQLRFTLYDEPVAKDALERMIRDCIDGKLDEAYKEIFHKNTEDVMSKIKESDFGLTGLKKHKD